MTLMDGTEYTKEQMQSLSRYACVNCSKPMNTAMCNSSLGCTAARRCARRKKVLDWVKIMQHDGKTGVVLRFASGKEIKRVYRTRRGAVKAVKYFEKRGGKLLTLMQYPNDAKEPKILELV